MAAGTREFTLSKVRLYLQDQRNASDLPVCWKTSDSDTTVLFTPRGSRQREGVDQAWMLCLSKQVFYPEPALRVCAMASNSSSCQTDRCVAISVSEPNP